MFIYEVNVDVSPGIADDYVAWLGAHVRAIQRIDGFLGADLYQVESDEEWRSYCVQYRVVDKNALAAYLNTDAPRLRAEGIARFGDNFRASRRVMMHIQRF